MDEQPAKKGISIFLIAILGILCIGIVVVSTLIFFDFGQEQKLQTVQAVQQSLPAAESEQAVQPRQTAVHKVVQEPESTVQQPEDVLQATERESVVLSQAGGKPVVGEKYGSVKISGTKVDTPLYYGDWEKQLSKGAGTYTGAKIPGQNGTVLLAGHTGTYFRDFENAQIGADIEVETRYGTYHYKISDMKVAREDDTTAYDLTKDEENIILYTCYPFGELKPTPYRYFIYGEFVSGPELQP